jgi:hypothetical protein
VLLPPSFVAEYGCPYAAFRSHESCRGCRAEHGYPNRLSAFRERSGRQAFPPLFALDLSVARVFSVARSFQSGGRAVGDRNALHCHQITQRMRWVPCLWGLGFGGESLY